MCFCSSFKVYPEIFSLKKYTKWKLFKCTVCKGESWNLSKKMKRICEQQWIDVIYLSIVLFSWNKIHNFKKHGKYWAPLMKIVIVMFRNIHILLQRDLICYFKSVRKELTTISMAGIMIMKPNLLEQTILLKALARFFSSSESGCSNRNSTR